MNKIKYSQVESDRFGIRVFRDTQFNFNISELRKQIIEQEVDLLILRLSSSNKSDHSKLLNLGFDYIHADTLVYYSIDLTNTKVSNLRNDLEFIIINENDKNIFDEIIPVIFKNYQNHYFSNPNLNEKDINDGYIEWVKSFTNENKICFLVKKDNNVVGFAACTFDKILNECEGILYGVMPDFSGMGIYTDLIRFTKKYFE